MGQEEIVYSFLRQYLSLDNLNEQIQLGVEVVFFSPYCICAVF